MAPTLARSDRAPNRLSIPDSPPSDMNDISRDVFIAHRVMRGDGVVEDITDFVHQLERLADIAEEGVPHPLHHWGVAVGDVIHHLQSEGFIDTPNYYESKSLPKEEGYILHKVGSTTFNDLAIQESGIRTIYDMPATYNILSNNCQTFTLKLLDIIVRAGRVQVKSAEAYAREWSQFIPFDEFRHLSASAADVDLAMPATVTAAVVQDPPAQRELLAHAQAIMAEETPTITKGNAWEAMEQQVAVPDVATGAVKVPEVKVAEVPLPEKTM